MKRNPLLGLTLTPALYVLLAVASACPGAPATTQVATTPTTSQPPTSILVTSAASTTPAMTSAQTVAQLADPGLTDFNSYCRSCHGRGGEGGSAPSLAGFGVRLAQYATAQGLFDRISATMPANTPGSLSQQQYFQITVYILLQNGYVTEEAVISDGFLAGIALS